MSPQANRDIITLPTDGSIQHNWLYSYLPVGVQNVPALLGFCKACRHQFIYYIPLRDYIDKDERYFEFDSKVPRWGCVPVE